LVRAGDGAFLTREINLTNGPQGSGGLTMSPLSPDSRTPPGAHAEDQPRPEPGHSVRVMLPSRGLMALLAGLLFLVIYLVSEPDPDSLARAILRGHTGQVNAVAFAPDGRTLASGGADHLARLWNVTTQGGEPRILEHAASVFALAFAPDGRTLATGG